MSSPGDRFCRQCGGRLADADKFCGRCGAGAPRLLIPPTRAFDPEELRPPQPVAAPAQQPPGPRHVLIAAPDQPVVEPAAAAAPARPRPKRRVWLWATLGGAVLLAGAIGLAAFVWADEIREAIAGGGGEGGGGGGDPSAVEVVLPDAAAGAEAVVRVVDDPPAPPEGFTPIGEAYEITVPEGTPAEGAWVRLPLEDDVTIPDGESLVIARHDGTAWQPIQAARGEGCAFARVPGFSKFWLGRVTLRMRPDPNEGPELRVDPPWLWALEVAGGEGSAVVDVSPAKTAWSPRRWRPVNVDRLEVFVTRPDRTQAPASARHFMPSFNETAATELRIADQVVTLRTTRQFDKIPLPIVAAPMQPSADTQVQQTYPWMIRVRPVFGDGQRGPLSAPFMVPAGVVEAHIRLREGLAARMDAQGASAFLASTAARPYWIFVSRANNDPWFWQRHRSGSYGPVLTTREQAQAFVYWGQADHRVLFLADDSNWERVITHEWGHYATHNMLGDASFGRFPAGQHQGWRPADSRRLAFSEDLATFLGQWGTGHGIPDAAGSMRGLWDSHARSPVGDAENLGSMWPQERNVDAARVEAVPATILSKLAREIGFRRVYGVLQQETPADIVLFFYAWRDAADVARLQRIYLEEGVAWRVRGTVLAEETPGATATPLEGATVRATTEAGDALVPPGDYFGEGRAEATTDASGAFELIVPPGDLIIEVRKRGYRPVDPPFRFGGVRSSVATNDPPQQIESRYLMRRGEAPTVRIESPADGDRVATEVTVSGRVEGTREGTPDGEPIEELTLSIGGREQTVPVEGGRFSVSVRVRGAADERVPIRAVATNEIGPGEHVISVRPGCPDERVLCEEVCVDPMTSDRHCGQCGTACGNGTTCVHGHCVGTGAMRISMSWSRAGDMDLRVVTPGDGEVYYGRRNGGGGQLDRDDTTGTGPENVFWQGNIPPGTYLVCVNAFSIRGPTSYTVDVFRQGTGSQTFTGTRGDSTGSGRSCARESPDFVTEVVVGGP